MQITKVYVEQFGKIEKKEISFSPDINIIYGPNESGKSTLEHFMLTMLYGHRTSRRYGVNPRGKYIPFDKDFAYGQMSFIEDAETYVIQRKIGLKRKDDFFRSFNEATYDQAGFDEHLGKEFFDLELEPFLKTLFITQSGTRFHAEKDESLTTKLTNLLETGDEDISFTKAIAGIEKEIKLIKGPRKSGELDKIYDNLSHLYGRLDEAKARRNQLNILEGELNDIKRDLELHEKKQETLKNLQEKIHLYQVKEEALSLFDHIENIQATKENQQNNLGIQRKEELQFLKDQVEELEKIREEIQEVAEELHGNQRDLLALDLELESYLGYKELPDNAPILLVKIQGEENLILEKLKQFEDQAFSHPEFSEKQDELTKLLHHYEHHLKKLKPRSKIRSQSIFVLAIVILLSYTILKNPLIGIVGLLGLGGIVFLNFKLAKYAKIKRLKKIENIEEEIKVLAKSLSMDPMDVIKSKRIIDGLPKKKEKTVLMNQLEKIQEQKQGYFNVTNRNTLEEFIQGDQIYRALHIKKEETLRQQKYLYERIQRQKDEEEKRWEKLSKNMIPLNYSGGIEGALEFIQGYEEHMERDINMIAQEGTLTNALHRLIGEKTREEYTEQLNLIEAVGLLEENNLEKTLEKTHEYEQESINLNEKMKRLMEEKENLEGEEPLMVEDEISTLLEEEARLTRRLLVLQTTKELMEASYEELRLEFIHELNEKVSDIFQTITNGDRKIKVAEHFSMKYEEERNIRMEEYLSKGSIDQLYLSLRLAMIDLMFKGKKVPLFLDEPFVSYDGERLRNVLTYLHNHKEKYQLFIFTCHQRETEVLKEFGHVISLENE